MADWLKLALVHTLVGFEADVLGILQFSGSGWTDKRALLIIAFLLYVVASALIVFTKMADLENNMVVSLIIIISLFIAAIFLIIGVGLHGRHENSYAATLEISAALFAILAGVFLVLTVVGGGAIKPT